MPPVRSRTALKMREETMSDTWRSPAQKPKSAIQSGQRTTTSTPNITSDRCARIQKERKGPLLQRPSEAETRWDPQAQDSRNQAEMFRLITNITPGRLPTPNVRL